MLLLLLTTLSGLALHSTSAYSARDLYGDELAEKAREAVAQVIDSIDRPRERQEPDAEDVEDLLSLLLRPKDRLAEDLHELRFLLELLNSQAEVETSKRMGGELETSQLGEATGAQTGGKHASSITLRRRSCSFRLGGHCDTENLDRAMKQYNYLRSPESPGRKKRSLHSILTNQITTNQ